MLRQPVRSTAYTTMLSLSQKAQYLFIPCLVHIKDKINIRMCKTLTQIMLKLSTSIGYNSNNPSTGGPRKGKSTPKRAIRPCK